MRRFCIDADVDRRAAERARRDGSEGAVMTKVGTVKFSGSSGGGMTSEDTHEGNELDGASPRTFDFLCIRSWICFCTRLSKGIEILFRCVRRVNGLMLFTDEDDGADGVSVMDG